ncbi:hypothetical protein [Roseicella sp. DB1501]|uniref:hypothetical protein n=1 Tax=Roseicella sp. DB1501 TaxID=2730925 RepID=UPI001492E84B|nr:hypothetical protein [Roseicella sp. DB1501]NOG73673.1 hypothetical protein [Roseicella sp. DB1501]
MAVFIERLDCNREGRRLSLLAASFNHEDFAMAPIGLPADDRRGVSPELLAKADREETDDGGP